MTPTLRFVTVLLVVMFAAPTASPFARAQAGSVPEAFTATTIRPDPEIADSTAVEINIVRWSTEMEKDRFARTLLSEGPAALLLELREARPVGAIQSPGSLPWSLRFAWQERTPDGGRRILMLTDRPIDWWELLLGSPTLEYPFSLIELRLNTDGEGDGRLSVATRIVVDPSLDLIELENYDDAPIRLTAVRGFQSTE
jgi:hypothetical protein